MSNPYLQTVTYTETELNEEGKRVVEEVEWQCYADPMDFWKWFEKTSPWALPTAILFLGEIIANQIQERCYKNTPIYEHISHWLVTALMLFVPIATIYCGMRYWCNYFPKAKTKQKKALLQAIHDNPEIIPALSEVGEESLLRRIRKIIPKNELEALLQK